MAENEPDWKAIAQALGLAVQRFRHSPELEGALDIRATEGYSCMCTAWEDYRDAGGLVMSHESFEKGQGAEK